MGPDYRGEHCPVLRLPSDLQSAKLTTYKAVPLAEVKNRPTKVSAPVRRCGPPNEPGRVCAKRRQDRTTSVNQAMDVAKATTR